jgi:adenylylsulfate kinase
MSSDQAFVVWITGRPAAGKTTLAQGMVASLRQRRIPVLWLDSDDLRGVLTPNASYDDAGRASFYKALTHIARRAHEGGVPVIVSATASRRIFREEARKQMSPFVEVMVDCDDATLHARDPKGLYAKADAGQLKDLPGHSSPFEAPEAADVTLNSSQLSVEEMLERLMTHLKGTGALG